MPTEACHRGDPQDLCKKTTLVGPGDGTDCQAWQQVPSPTKPPRENLTEAPGVLLPQGDLTDLMSEGLSDSGYSD